MSLINKKYVDATVLSDDAKGVANGVATLDAQGRIPSAQLPTSATEYKGMFNPITPAPNLQNGTGTNGDLYRVSDNGGHDFGAGLVNLFIGDLVIYNGATYEVAPESSSFQGKTTDDLPEGSSNFYYTIQRFDTSLATRSTSNLAEGTNLYFTEPRVLGTTLAGFANVTAAPITSTDTVTSGFNKLQSQISGIGPGIVNNQQVVTLSATDITNGYYDLANTPLNGVVQVKPTIGPVQNPTLDFTVSTNRVTFAGDLATNLEANDVVIFTYLS